MAFCYLWVLHYTSTWPPLSSNTTSCMVTPLCNDITFWDISTPVSYSYASFICESKDSLTTKSWDIICQYFSWHAAFKEDGLQFSHDGQRILTCQLAPHSEMCWPGINQCQESIATVMGYVHTKPIPVVSHFNSSLFLPGRSWVNRLTFFASLYYWSDYYFCGRGAYSTAEIGHMSDARMSTLLMYGSDSFRCQLNR